MLYCDVAHRFQVIDVIGHISPVDARSLCDLSYRRPAYAIVVCVICEAQQDNEFTADKFFVVIVPDFTHQFDAHRLLRLDVLSLG
jgi:hypothetical protein